MECDDKGEIILADNDRKVVKLIKKVIKTAAFRVSYIGKKILSAEDGNEKIYNAIESGKPYAVVRYGAVEARCVSVWMSSGKYSEYNYKSIKEAAGFFPNTDEYMNQFASLYATSSSKADMLAVWGVKDERKMVDCFCNNATLVNIMSLEPYFYAKPWSRALRNKRVLIIHPFIESIKCQLDNNRTSIFDNKNILPEFKEVHYIKAVQSNGDTTTEYATWFDALETMKKQIDSIEFDVAIIGAGAYGLPLAIHCKELGKIAIQMAGATQILFGIRGKRWDEREKYVNLFNSSWIRPANNEAPKGKDKIEGGTYW